MAIREGEMANREREVAIREGEMANREREVPNRVGEVVDTLQRNTHLCILRKGIALSQSQFPHSCVCE